MSFPTSGPFRAVVTPRLREGSVCLMLPVKGRWWDLELECGHFEERSMRYEHQGGRNRGWSALWHPPGLDKALPPPKKVRCSACGVATATPGV